MILLKRSVSLLVFLQCAGDSLLGDVTDVDRNLFCACLVCERPDAPKRRTRDSASEPRRSEEPRPRAEEPAVPVEAAPVGEPVAVVPPVAAGMLILNAIAGVAGGVNGGKFVGDTT